MDWLGRGEEFLIDPRVLRTPLVGQDLSVLRRLLPRLPGHIWFFTSGTSQAGQLKWVALSKQALLCSSAAVNAHLSATASDRWLCLLPQFHVGGAQILSRAFLSRSQVITANWDIRTFTSLVCDNSVTLLSLVPQQLYDLVTHNIQSPPSLRAIIIGGGTLTLQLYNQAKELGYPVMPSYGLTECSSQVATADLRSPHLNLLPHIEAKIEHSPEDEGNQGRLWIKSEALLTGYALISDYLAESSPTVQFIDPKVDGWLRTEDIATLDDSTEAQTPNSEASYGGRSQGTLASPGKVLTIMGRADDSIKISGHLINVAKLRSQLHALGLSPTSSTIISLPDTRRENRLILVLEEHLKTSPYIEKIDLFLSGLPSPERPREVCWLPEMPKTPLGKIKVGELRETIRNLTIPIL